MNITTNSTTRFPTRPFSTYAINVRGLVDGNYTIANAPSTGGALFTWGTANLTANTTYQVIATGNEIGITFAGVSTFTNLAIEYREIEGPGELLPGGVAQPVSAAALPLPTGASVSALQLPLATTVSGNITTQNLVPAGVATAGSAVELIVGGLTSAQVQVVGTYTGALSLQATLDGTNWVTVGGFPFFNANTGASLATITSALQSILKVDISGLVRVRITGLAAMTGTATVTIVGGQSSTHVNSTVNSGLNAPVNVAQVAGITLSNNKGASGTGSQRVVVAATAHSAASTENPVLIGGFVTSTLDTTLVQGDVGQLSMTTAGQLIQKPFASSENDWQYAAAAGGITNTTTAVTIKAAGAASIRNFITGITVMADALGAATELAVRDGAAGTVIWRIKIPVGGLPATYFTFNTPLRGTAATLMEVVTLTASVTGSVYFNAQGYQSF